MRQLPPMHRHDEPLGCAGWLILGVIALELVALLWIAGAFRPLG